MFSRFRLFVLSHVQCFPLSPFSRFRTFTCSMLSRFRRFRVFVLSHVRCFPVFAVFAFSCFHTFNAFPFSSFSCFRAFMFNPGVFDNVRVSHVQCFPVFVVFAFLRFRVFVLSCSILAFSITFVFHMFNAFPFSSFSCLRAFMFNPGVFDSVRVSHVQCFPVFVVFAFLRFRVFVLSCSILAFSITFVFHMINAFRCRRFRVYAFSCFHVQSWRFR